MSHLIKIYTVCPIVFKYQFDIAWIYHFLKNFAGKIFVVCFLVVEKLKNSLEEFLIFIYSSAPLSQSTDISKEIFWDQKICFEISVL